MPAEPPSAGSRGPAALERRRDDRRAVLLLATLIAFEPLSTDLYLPSMPSIGTAMYRGLFSFLSEASFVFGGVDAGPLPAAAR
jgi:hypothetical protein